MSSIDADVVTTGRSVPILRDDVTPRAQLALQSARRQLGQPVGEPPAAFEALDAAVGATVAELVETLQDPKAIRRAGLGDLVASLVELQNLHVELREHRTGQRLQSLANVHDGLERLRRIDNPAKMIERCPMEVCHSCGFDRAVLSRVEGSQWIVFAAHYVDDQPWADAFVEFSRGQAPPELTHMVLETEMIRRRGPALVLDAAGDPRTYKPMTEYADVRSYVAAPIMPEGRVIGFIHADHYHTERLVDSSDRDTLWAFAEGFGHAFERAVLLERLGRQREEVRQMMRSTEDSINDMCTAEIQLAATEHDDVAVVRSAASLFISPESRVQSLLTRRELEVLELMASGATNAGIADQLVITEGTVKSHVKHILRKLRAANRAEAVSRYLHLAMKERG